MATANHPSKEQVRAYMARRQAERQEERKPPPTPEEIRRELGWGLMQQPNGGR